MRNTNSDVQRVVAYVRVSTDQQATEGLSLETQRKRLEQYAEVYGLTIVGWYEDAGASASSLDRPGLQGALEALERGEAQGLLVVKLDRLTRNVRDLCDLVEEYFRGECALLSVSEHIDTRSAAGRMMLNMLTVIGQWEREAIGERTAAVMQHMKASGMFTGGFPPIGYKVEGDRLVEDEDEQLYIRTARALRAQGASLRQIAAELPSNPRTGKRYDARQISRML